MKKPFITGINGKESAYLGEFLLDKCYEVSCLHELGCEAKRGLRKGIDMVANVYRGD